MFSIGLGGPFFAPLIWRQRQPCSESKLTKRLRFALKWFVRVLELGVAREIRLNPSPSMKMVFLYSDAEGNGGVGAVAVMPDGTSRFLQGQVPRSVVR